MFLCKDTDVTTGELVDYGNNPEDILIAKQEFLKLAKNQNVVPLLHLSRIEWLHKKGVADE